MEVPLPVQPYRTSRPPPPLAWRDEECSGALYALCHALNQGDIRAHSWSET
ncbi:hypothetical protein WMY93_007740 [Mugilogobius chulae]|uniref:Uncharacterized protein n=1 Tax=Mugilogobius chulae TaxID=88201 RepID=A0AAW0PPJ7_9GOBI